MKILLLGIAFILAGIAFLSFPESYAAIFIAGIACETLASLLAVIGAVKKEPKRFIIIIQVIILKTLLLGIAFAIAGAGCLAFPEPFGPLYLIGLACEAIGLLLAIIGAVKKDPIDK